MFEEKKSTTSTNFIESERNYYDFLIQYTEALLLQSNNIRYLHTNREKYETQIILALSLIENIRLHLFTRQILFENLPLAKHKNEPIHQRDQLAKLIQYLKSLQTSDAHTNINDAILMYNTTPDFPDYSFYNSIKGFFEDEPITINPWQPCSKRFPG